mmetsp:Transcript_92022/g.287996  ORF Transcript_92022/g.287996 Transcript_92022/m.287996 type:complete len:99 (-) Transcript_92022:135-431(-)
MHSLLAVSPCGGQGHAGTRAHQSRLDPGDGKAGNCGRHVQTLERKRHVDGDAWLELSWAGSLVEVLHHGVHDGSGDAWTCSESWNAGKQPPPSNSGCL